MQKVGITVDLRKSLWSNGINQNGIYLANVLNKIGYEAYLIYVKDKDSEPITEVNGIKVITFTEAFTMSFSVLIQLGITVSKSNFEKFKAQNDKLKLVAYKCGNDLIIDMESIIFEANKQRTESLSNSKKDPSAKPDQIWAIPQMEVTNLNYYSFMYKQDNATVVPFIWDPMAINSECEDLGYSTYSKRKLHRIGIMEPNLSVMKNVLLPIAILEKQFQVNNFFNKVYLIGAEKLKSNKRLIQILNHTEIHANKLVTVEPRIPVIDAINKYVDIVLSWQWENNLNYLWLDVAWMGWPLVHNGNLCQDIGYYYDGFNIDQGQLQLQKVIEHHNDDTSYLERNRLTIKRYTIENQMLLDNYKILMENLLSDSFIKYEYDWKTNSIN